MRDRDCGCCFYRTAFGRVVRAGVQTPDMVGALGISLEPYMAGDRRASAWASPGLAGVLLAPICDHPSGDGAGDPRPPAFVVVVIGGLGSFWGVVAAALLVGVVQGPHHLLRLPARRAKPSMYLLMLLVLLFRPRGLFGERIQKFE